MVLYLVVSFDLIQIFHNVIRDGCLAPGLLVHKGIDVLSRTGMMCSRLKVSAYI